MVFQKILSAIKSFTLKEDEYPNRFLKFYHLNHSRLNKERRGSYYHKKKTGTCVRCKQPRADGIIFCTYHQNKQKEYNAKARTKNQ